jgi:hypothetical protein
VDDGATGTVTPAATITTGFSANVPATIPSGNVANVVVNPFWYDETGGDAIHDQALLILSSPVTGVLPADIWLGNPVGMIGTLLGYGYQDTGLGTASTANGYGYNLPGATDLLAAQNMIDALDPILGLESDFDNPAETTSSLGSATPLPLEGTTCFGDSGGPLFVTINGQAMLVGDLNGGASSPYGPSCYYGDVSNWAPLNNPENVSFIASNDSAADFVGPEPARAVLIGSGLLAAVAVRRGWRRT